ncbi:cytochrome b6-f complex iron-sulfur subunit [Bryocella elongata]|uniref:Cytochrome b6-f complex iron-sulfur subunit n=1 Tax=Bryocella elongata TaxID=863522 RepID=A0A1H5T9P6_9BACT|nr:Rieske (2Fe-2S) protein [Bryocella elongata]SEF59516.1 cytochrome b6-f complex iron-sulfur subunit [Bryocella elongata]
MSDTLVNITNPEAELPGNIQLDPARSGYGEDGESPTTRRAFLVGAGCATAAYAAALAYPVYRYLASPIETAMNATAVKEVTLKDAQKLPMGSVMMFKFGPSPAMLIHHLDGKWVAFTAVCTHLGCTVQYEAGPDRIHCACHGGVYNSQTGANVSGPPPKPLLAYKVAVNDADVQISRA